MSKKNVFSILVLAFTIATLLFSCSNSSNENTVAPLLKIPTVSLVKDTVTTYTEFPAEIKGQNDNDIRPKISGYITKVLVEEGMPVTKGQALFKLETNIQTENASAAQASISAAEANVRAAQVEVNKLIPLVQKGIISQVQLETANARLMQANAQLSQARASYNSIMESINFSTVKSPINGNIGKINYREGSLVSPQDPTPLTTVSDIKVVYAYFTLNEKQFIDFFEKVEGKTIDEKIKNLPEVELKLANGSIYDLKGEITSSTGQIDSRTGTLKFRVDFKNNGLLNSGSTGRIIIPKKYEDVLVVPETATFEQQGKLYAYKLFENDSIYAKVITPIERTEKLIIISDGLKEGDKIVGEGIINVKNSLKINPIETTIDSLISIKTIF